MNEQQAQAMAKLAAAETNLRSAKCSKIKYEIRVAREHLALCKKEAKKIGCVLPTPEKKTKLRNIAGRVSWSRYG